MPEVRWQRCSRGECAGEQNGAFDAGAEGELHQAESEEGEMSALTKGQKLEFVGPNGLARRAFNLEGARARGQRQDHLTPALSPRGGEGETVSTLTGIFAIGRFPSLQDALNALAANGSEACFTTWRHEQVKLAVGKNGLRLCSQLDYQGLRRHFLHLLGEDGQALKADLRHQSEPTRQARAVLAKALQRWGFHSSYAEAICRNQYKVELDDATPKQIWQIVYTVNKRGAKRKREALSSAANMQKEEVAA